MADMPYTARRARAHPSDEGLCPFTTAGFAALTDALRHAVLLEEDVDVDVDIDGADAGRAQHRAEGRAISAWVRAEAVAARFVRSHVRAHGAAAVLAETAERVLAVMTLDGLEERGEVFEIVSDTMLVRTRVAEGLQACAMLGALLPWMYRAARIQADLLPDPGPDDVEGPGVAGPSRRDAAPDFRMPEWPGTFEIAEQYPL